MARLACAGGAHVARHKARYAGLESCRAAALVSGGGKGCSWGCLGLADCARACDFDAIEMDQHDLPVVSEIRCTACGDCVEVCPKDLFSLHPVSHRLWVACRNLLNGEIAEAECEVACTGCGRCAADAPAGLIKIVNNLAVIDYARNQAGDAKADSALPHGRDRLDRREDRTREGSGGKEDHAQISAAGGIGGAAAGDKRGEGFTGLRSQPIMGAKRTFRFPGVRQAMDGNTAVIMCERESTDAAGAYPITPSTQMGEYWAEETAKGHINISGRPLIFIEPEGEHAAAAVTAGLSMTGLRATNFSSGQGIAYMHESLYAAVGKRLTYVLNMGCRAMTKATLNVHAGHDDYHCIDDTGFFQLFGKSAQEVCDLNIILASHRRTGADARHLRAGRISHHAPDRVAAAAGARSDCGVSGSAGRHHRHADAGATHPLRPAAPPHSGTMDGGQSGDDRHRAEPGRLHAKRRGAASVFLRPHRRPLPTRRWTSSSNSPGRRYKRVSTYRAEDADYLILGHGQHDRYRRSRGRLPARDAQDQSRRGQFDHVPAFSGRPAGRYSKRTQRRCCAGAGGSTAGRRSAADPGNPLRRSAAAWKTAVSPMDTCRIREYASYQQAGGHAAALFRFVRTRQPRFATGRPDRRDREHAAQWRQEELLTISLSISRTTARSRPKQEIHQIQVADSYPGLKELAVHGSENPNLMPKNSITVRMHSVGGWGAITTGKNLAMTLFDLLGYHIKANPKYGSEKKGQPTTYYLSAAPEPIRINCDYFYVDVVLSPDPNVFQHSNPLAGLKKGGVFILQSAIEQPEEVWAQIPEKFQRIIIENHIRVFYLDAFKIAREEANDPELQFRMQGIAFQGAFFATSPVMTQANLNEQQLFNAIRSQLEHKFGSKGARVVEDNIRVVRRGFDEVQEITNKRSH